MNENENLPALTSDEAVALLADLRAIAGEPVEPVVLRLYVTEFHPEWN